MRSSHNRGPRGYPTCTGPSMATTSQNWLWHGTLCKVCSGKHAEEVEKKQKDSRAANWKKQNSPQCGPALIGVLGVTPLAKPPQGLLQQWGDLPSALLPAAHVPLPQGSQCTALPLTHHSPEQQKIEAYSDFWPTKKVYQEATHTTFLWLRPSNMQEMMCLLGLTTASDSPLSWYTAKGLKNIFLGTGSSTRLKLSQVTTHNTWQWATATLTMHCTAVALPFFWTQEQAWVIESDCQVKRFTN